MRPPSHEDDHGNLHLRAVKMFVHQRIDNARAISSARLRSAKRQADETWQCSYRIIEFHSSLLEIPHRVS